MNAQSEHAMDAQELRWIRRAKKRNHHAFEQLVMKYQRTLYVAVRKIVMNHDDATDIVQESFVKAYQSLDQFDERYPFYPWLFRIGINLSLNQQQKIRRQRETFVKQDEEQMQRLAAGQATPLEQVLQNELEDQVAIAMAELPFEQRLVFVLKTSEELSYQEISESLDISLGTVMSRLSRARAKLKERLQPYLTFFESEE